MAALMVTANSGAEVPIATTVRPMTKSEILKEAAMLSSLTYQKKMNQQYMPLQKCPEQYWKILF